MTRTTSKVFVAALFAAIYAVPGLVRHWHFGSSAYDLGIFDQVVWHLSRFETPASTVHGFANMFGDHFSPILVLFVPFYWIHPAPETLIVTQALLFGASVIPVWIFLERRLPPDAAALMALAYGCFWGLQRAAQFDVHEMAFAPLLVAVMLMGVDRARDGNPWPLFAAGALPLLFVKEDLIPLVAAAALLLASRTRQPRDRRRAVFIAALSVAFFGIVVRWVIPSLSGTGAYSAGSAFRDVLAHPAQTLVRLASPPVKLQTLSMWFLPFALLPLASPYGLLIVPLALERFLSASPNHWGTSFHYSAPLAPILAMAAGDGLARLAAYAGRSFSSGGSATLKLRPTYIAALCLLLSAVLPGRQPMWKLLSPSFHRAPAFAETARKALAVIPPGASVVAQAAIGPHLGGRAENYTLRAEGPNSGIDAAYVIAAPDDLSPWPLAGAAGVNVQLAVYRARGYATVFEERGWVVLKRGGEVR